MSVTAARPGKNTTFACTMQMYASLSASLKPGVELRAQLQRMFLEGLMHCPELRMHVVLLAAGNAAPALWWRPSCQAGARKT